MTTDELVSRLSANATPVQARSAKRAIGPALALGAATSISLASLVFNSITNNAGDPGMPGVARIAVGLALGSVGLALLLPSLRPGSPSRWIGRSEAAISILLAGLLLEALASKSLAELAVVFALAGPLHSPLTITALSIPIFLLLIAAIRNEAPTRLDLTGAALGLLSGGVGAAIFFLTSPSEPATSAGAWFAIGVGLAMLGGTLVGPRMLRW